MKDELDICVTDTIFCLEPAHREDAALTEILQYRNLRGIGWYSRAVESFCSLSFELLVRERNFNGA